jgi:hypothetical protein
VLDDITDQRSFQFPYLVPLNQTLGLELYLFL